MSNSAIKHIAVVAGLIFDNQRLLVCQRHERSPFPLKWEFPGGKVERGESDNHALRRELQEELNIEVLRSTEIFRHQHVYPDAAAVDLRFFQVDKFKGEIRNRVFQQILWVEVEALEQLDFLAGDLPFIRELLGPNRLKLIKFPMTGSGGSG